MTSRRPLHWELRWNGKPLPTYSPPCTVPPEILGIAPKMLFARNDNLLTSRHAKLVLSSQLLPNPPRQLHPINIVNHSVCLFVD